MRALGSAEQVGAASVVGWASEGETHGAEAAELQSSAEPRPHAGLRDEIWRNLVGGVAPRHRAGVGFSGGGG